MQDDTPLPAKQAKELLRELKKRAESLDYREAKILLKEKELEEQRFTIAKTIETMFKKELKSHCQSDNDSGSDSEEFRSITISDSNTKKYFVYQFINPIKLSKHRNYLKSKLHEIFKDIDNNTLSESYAQTALDKANFAFIVKELVAGNPGSTYHGMICGKITYSKCLKIKVVVSRRGYGYSLMEVMLFSRHSEFATHFKKLFPDEKYMKVYLKSVPTKVGFYESLGFEPYSLPYEEIVCVRMHRFIPLLCPDTIITS
ncbi:hypothetical protein ACTFIZ_000168 [Dictyostelium cf. discoideum]